MSRILSSLSLFSPESRVLHLAAVSCDLCALGEITGVPGVCVRELVE